MTPETRAPTRILAVADANDSGIALETAVSLADEHGATLDVMACVDPPHDLSILARLSGQKPEALIEEAVELTRKTVRGRLDQIAGGREVDLSVSVGKAYLEIIRHVARSHCDFVVKAAEPLSGLDRFFFASTDQHLLRKCPCPVWLLTPRAQTHPRTVLVAIDLDLEGAAEPQTLRALNRRVMEAACMLPCAPDAEIVVLHAWDAIGEGIIWAFSNGNDMRIAADRYVNEVLAARQDAMDRFLTQVRQEIGPTSRLIACIERGSPEKVIHDKVKAIGADVLVMGTVARTGLHGVIIGNTAENIINSLDCSVLAVKPDSFASPLLEA